MSRRATCWSLAVVLASVACSRHADVREEEPARFGDPERAPPVPAQMPVVGGASELDAAPACAVRESTVDCIGPIDFACAPETMVRSFASHCVYESGCRGNGWIRVTTTSEGCIASLAMEEPNAAFAACMFPKLRAVRCPCSGQSVDVFLGLGHEGDAGVVCVKPRG